MSKPSENRHKKQLRKKRKQAEKTRKFQQRVAAFEVFPRVLYAENDAPAGLVDAVKQAMRRLALEHAKLFQPDFVQYLHAVRHVGFPEVFTRIRQADREVGRNSASYGLSLGVAAFILGIGEALFSLISAAEKERYYPFHNVDLLPGTPRPDVIKADFRSLLQAKTRGGTAYYSPHRPTLRVGNEEKIVAFSTHAARRISERTVFDWRRYASLGEALAFLREYVNYEPCELRNAEYAFTLHNHCEPGFFTYRFAEELLEDLDPEKQYHYRVGYCPAVVSGDFLVAKTLLIPGMDITPEFERVLRRAAHSHGELEQFRCEASKMTLAALSRHGDFSLFKRFHEGGVPQVVERERGGFRNPYHGQWLKGLY